VKTPAFPIHYRTLENGVVTLDQESEYAYTARCGSCGDTKSDNIRDTRAWANTHAGQCRAIPQTGQAQPGR
jgi:hypothetical protein